MGASSRGSATGSVAPPAIHAKATNQRYKLNSLGLHIAHTHIGEAVLETLTKTKSSKM